MRSATLFIFFVLLTISSVSAGVQAAPEVPSGLFQPSDKTIESLERLHSRAESQIVENDFDGAIRTYKDILLLEPDDEDAYAGMGNCYLLMGQYRNAYDAYQYALSINPQNESAILGTQKIMDPDGVEGMIHPLQVEAEGAVTVKEPAQAVASKTLPVPQRSPAKIKISKPVAPKPKAPRKILTLSNKPPLPVARERSAFSDPRLAAPKLLPRESSVEVAVKAKAVLEPKPYLEMPERLEPEKTAPLSPLPAAEIFVPAPPSTVMPGKIVVFDTPAADKKKAGKKPASKTIIQKTSAPAASSDAVDAREIQKALRNTGFYSGPIDGVLGPVSRNAIKEYQILHELIPDGIVGAKTWSTLRLYLDRE